MLKQLLWKNIWFSHSRLKDKIPNTLTKKIPISKLKRDVRKKNLVILYI